MVHIRENGVSGEYSTKYLSTEEIGGKNLIGSLANYVTYTGLSFSEIQYQY